MSEAKSRIGELAAEVFDGLAEPDITTILAAAEGRFVRRGEVIIAQGERADVFVLLLTGRARYFYVTPNGEKLLLMWLTPGEPMGTSALCPNSAHYLASAEAVRDSSMLVWSRPVIRRLALLYPRFMGNALSVASSYLDWYIATHVALTCEAAPQRLAHVLSTLASRIGRMSEQGTTIDITNEELASAANITTFTTSRLLARWNSRKLIKKTRGKIVLSAPDRLWREPL